jgi:acyl carrier protein
MNDLRDQLNALLITKLDLEPGTLAADQTLESLGLDSLDIVKLATAMEGEFGVEFDEDELFDDITLDDLVKLLGDRLSADQRG